MNYVHGVLRDISMVTLATPSTYAEEKEPVLKAL